MKPGPHYVVETARLAPWARRSAHGVGLVLLVSGIAWLVLHTWVRVPGAFGPAHHPAEIWLMRVHGLVALPALLGLGAVLARHVGPGWRVHRRRASGLALLLGTAVLALGGWGLYYANDDTLRHWLALSHWLLGLALPAAAVWHIVGIQRQRRAQERAARRTVRL